MTIKAVVRNCRKRWTHARHVWHELWRISRVCVWFVICYSWLSPWLTWWLKKIYCLIISYTLSPRLWHSSIHPLTHFFIAGDVKTSRKSWLVVKEAKYLRSTRFISQRGTGRKRFIRDKSLKERKNVSCKLSKSLPLSPLLSCGDQTGQSRPFNKQFFGYEFCSYSVFCTFIIDISTRFSINGLVLNTPCDSPEQITETHR